MKPEAYLPSEEPMYIAIIVLSVLAILLNWRNRRQVSKAYKAVEAARQRALDLDDKYHALLAASMRLDLSNRVALMKIHLLTVALFLSQTASKHWENYGIAYEVLCEACAEGDEVGAHNARNCIANERDILRALGQYDD
jgi:hypothetical protein